MLKIIIVEKFQNWKKKTQQWTIGNTYNYT